MNPKASLAITVLAYLLAILSVAAGIPKILQMPQELEFLSAIGLSATAVSVLGVFQLVGGVLMPWKRTRLTGAVLAALALLVSSVAIFSAGNTRFGLVSLLPFIVALIVIYATMRGSSAADAGEGNES